MDTSELRRLLEAATPGEWENWPEIGATFGPDGEAIQTCGTGFHGERAEEFKANAAIIPAMRNALPALLDRLDALEEVAEAARRLEFLSMREGEGFNEHFERIGARFCAETGYLRPGKDCVLHSPEERGEGWAAWINSLRDALTTALARLDGEASDE